MPWMEVVEKARRLYLDEGFMIFWISRILKSKSMPLYISMTVRTQDQIYN